MRFYQASARWVGCDRQGRRAHCATATHCFSRQLKRLLGLLAGSIWRPANLLLAFNERGGET